MSAKENRNCTWATERISVQLILKADIKVDKTRDEGYLFQYYTTRKENALPLRRRRLGPCSNL